MTNCCQCRLPVSLGSEIIPEGEEQRKDLAIRCVYCLALFCVKCSYKHFETRNAGKVQKRIIKRTTVEEWIEEPKAP